MADLYVARVLASRKPQEESSPQNITVDIESPLELSSATRVPAAAAHTNVLRSDRSEPQSLCHIYLLWLSVCVLTILVCVLEFAAAESTAMTPYTAHVLAAVLGGFDCLVTVIAAYLSFLACSHKSQVQSRYQVARTSSMQQLVDRASKMQMKSAGVPANSMGMTAGFHSRLRSSQRVLGTLPKEKGLADSASASSPHPILTRGQSVKAIIAKQEREAREAADKAKREALRAARRAATGEGSAVTTDKHGESISIESKPSVVVVVPDDNDESKTEGDSKPALPPTAQAAADEIRIGETTQAACAATVKDAAPLAAVKDAQLVERASPMQIPSATAPPPVPTSAPAPASVPAVTPETDSAGNKQQAWLRSWPSQYKSSALTRRLSATSRGMTVPVVITPSVAAATPAAPATATAAADRLKNYRMEPDWAATREKLKRTSEAARAARGGQFDTTTVANPEIV